MFRKTKFVPSHDNLEDRNLLSAARPRLHVAKLPASHVARVQAHHAAKVHVRNASPSSGLPFVVAPAGVNQFAINMTTHTFNQVIFGNAVRGGGYNVGLNQAIDEFVDEGDQALLDSRLTILAGRAPYGGTDLLPLLQDAVAAGGTVQDLQASAQQVVVDYITDGVSSGTFNYLQSVQHSSTDKLIANNGKVGQTPLD